MTPEERKLVDYRLDRAQEAIDEEEWLPQARAFVDHVSELARHAP